MTMLDDIADAVKSAYPQWEVATVSSVVSSDRFIIIDTGDGYCCAVACEIYEPPND